MIAENSDVLAGVDVGVVGSWGYPRGRDRVGLRIAEQLVSAGARVHAFSLAEAGPGGLPRGCSTATVVAEHARESGGGPRGVSATPDAAASAAQTDAFVHWLRSHPDRSGPLRAVIFVELDAQTDAFVGVTRIEGIATLAALVWEQVYPARAEEYRRFDAVLSPHAAFEEVLSGMRIPAIPFRWGWRPPLPKPPLTDGEQIEFLHIAGEQAAWMRKGTERVAAAFLRLAGESEFAFRIATVDPFPTELGTQLRDAGVQVQEGRLPDQRLEARVRGARVMVQPSLWEGIGLPILESLAEGTPVVTTDGPPMNLYIRNKAEGILVPTEPREHPELAVPLLDYSVDDLVESLLLLRDRDLLRHLEQKALAGGASRVDPERACRDLAEGVRDLVATSAGQH